MDRGRLSEPRGTQDTRKPGGSGQPCVVVNDERVFRFPRNEWAREMQMRELRVLDLLAPRLELAIPSADYRAAEMISYAIIPGVALTRNRLLRMEPTSQERIIEQLATFLVQMHTTPLPEGLQPSAAQRDSEQHLPQYTSAQRKLLPLLMADQVAWVHDLYAPLLADPGFLSTEPTLINGDLGCYHILCDPDSDKLTGIIDFGTAGTGDPAVDFGALISMYGETLVAQLSRHYPRLPDLIERARFYAGQVELFWLLSGLGSGDLSWFTVHLSRARYALPIGCGWPKADRLGGTT